MQITYQKRNGCIFQRLRNTSLPYKIGDSTSMGWTVLNIEYEYKGKYYPEYQYNMLIYKNKQKYMKKKQFKEQCILNTKTLLYYLLGYIFLNYIRIRIGI